MVKVDRTNDRLFMRGTGTDPVIHITLGDPSSLVLDFAQTPWTTWKKQQAGQCFGIEFRHPAAGRSCVSPIRTAIPSRSGGQEQAEEIVPRFKVNDVDNKDVHAGELTRIPPGPSMSKGSVMPLS